MILAAVLFAISATAGATYYARDIRQGGHPFFYQTYFEPAVMTACGRGFVISHEQPIGLRDFLFEKRDRFSCDELPRNLPVGTDGLYQRPWRYLMTTVAVAWMVLGISWSGLAPLFGVLYGAATATAYALFRLLVGRIAALAAAVALCFSPLQLSNLPNLRDYAKAPFTVALIAILVALVIRDRRRRDVLFLSAAYGLVLGIGYGFRTDLLIDIPPFLVTVALFLPGGVSRNVGLKLAAAALFASCFLVSAWPIVSAVASTGGCQWHVFLLGLTDPFNEPLGVSAGAYSWGRLYRDESLWAAVSSYASRTHPDLGYIEYCSHQYDVASWAYLRQILQTFPADMVTRAYASALHVIDLPVRRVPVLPGLGPLLTGTMVVAVSVASLRLGLFALFAVVYFGGYPAIQFLPRHYFPFEIIGLAVLAFLIERGLQAGRRFAEKRVAGAAIDRRRLLWCAAVMAALLYAPLGVLRWYQNGRATRLLQSYLEAPAALLTLQPAAGGRYQLPAGMAHHARSNVEAVEALGRPSTLFIDVRVDASACRPHTRVTFRYDSAYPFTDLSHDVTLEPASRSGATHLFEPVYDGFTGLEVSDPTPACALTAFVVTGLNRSSLVLPAQLAPGWESQPQYQRIAHLR